MRLVCRAARYSSSAERKAGVTGRSQDRVEPLDDAKWVGHEVLVEDVGDLVVGHGTGVALGGHGVHLHLHAHGHELDEDGVVDMVRMHVVQCGHEVGQRPDDAQRVAMHEHDPGVGIGGEEERQGGQV